MIIDRTGGLNYLQYWALNISELVNMEKLLLRKEKSKFLSNWGPNCEIYYLVLTSIYRHVREHLFRMSKILRQIKSWLFKWSRRFYSKLPKCVEKTLMKHLSLLSKQNRFHVHVLDEIPSSLFNLNSILRLKLTSKPFFLTWIMLLKGFHVKNIR